MKVTPAAALFLLLPLPLGCDDTLVSGGVRTSGLYPVYQAVATGNGKTEVTAQLRAETSEGAYVSVESPDTLSASAAGSVASLSVDANAEHPTYVGKLPGDDEGLKIQVHFERGNEGENAPDSQAALPAPFELAVDGTNTVEPGGSVRLTWEEGPGQMVWTAKGICMNPKEGTIPDSGELILDGSDVVAWSDATQKSCEVTITLERSSPGTVDPAFESGGQFVAVQRRTISLNPPPSTSDLGPGGNRN